MTQENNTERHFTASALILHEDKVLLVFHKKMGVWLYPGGHIEKDENPDQAVIREVKEETGLDVEIEGFIDENLADVESDVTVLQKPYEILCERISGNNPHYHIDMVYKCLIIKHDDVIKFKHNPDESAGIAFFAKEDIKGINLFPNFRRLLEKVLEA